MSSAPAVPTSRRDGSDEAAVGVSFEFLRRFMQIGTRPPTDSRVGRPLLDLVRDDVTSPYFAAVRERYRGLPSPIETHLELHELKSLARDLRIEVRQDDPCGDDDLEDPATWAKALTRSAVTTADVCLFCLIPDTAAGVSGAAADVTCSYVELLQEQASLDDEGRPLVGPATHFVSHAWSYDFTTLCRALYEFYDQRPLDDDHRSMYFWIDIFSVNQHVASAGQLSQDFWETTFTDMIASIGKTVVVMLPWSNPTPVTRIWCLWEIFSTIERGAELWIALPELEEKALSDAVVTDCQDAIRRVQIDAESAKATAPVDKERITQLILAQHGDFEKINTLVRGALLGIFLCQIAYHDAAPGELTRLVRSGAIISLTARPSGSARRRSAIGHAAARGHLPCVKELHAVGADLLTADPCRGFTPLHLAAINGHTDLVKWLVETTGRVTESREAFYGRTPLHCAVAVGDEASVACLVDLGADVTARDACFSTPLSLALRQTNEEGGIREFDEQKQKTWEGDKALTARKARIAVYLADRGAPGVTLPQQLAEACARIDPVEVAILLQTKSDDDGEGIAQVLNAEMTTPTGSYRCTPIGHLLGTPHAAVPEDPAVLLDQVNILNQLISSGSRVDCVVQSMSPGQLIVQQHLPLQLAAHRGLLSVVSALVEHGADPFAKSTDHDGALTALHYAAKNHRTGVIKYLIGRNTDLIHDRVAHGHCAGLTALGLARRVGHPSSDGYAHMLPATRARRLVAIDVLLSVARDTGETGDELHNGVPDPERDLSESPPAPPSEEFGLTELVAFGFAPEAATLAMQKTSGDCQAALELLLSEN